MSTETPLVGVLGTIATFGLGQVSHIIGIVAGLLTCTLVMIQIVKNLKGK
jgi:hypothetical protein